MSAVALRSLTLVAEGDYEVSEQVCGSWIDLLSRGDLSPRLVVRLAEIADHLRHGGVVDPVGQRHDREPAGRHDRPELLEVVRLEPLLVRGANVFIDDAERFAHRLARVRGKAAGVWFGFGGTGRVACF